MLGNNQVVVFDVKEVTIAICSEDLKKENYKLYAVEQVKDSVSLEKFSMDAKLAVIFGNEVTGVEQSTIHLCDGCIEIPQLGMKHSLNIATAAGVVLWEIVRTRINKI